MSRLRHRQTSGFSAVLEHQTVKLQSDPDLNLLRGKFLTNPPIIIKKIRKKKTELFFDIFALGSDLVNFVLFITAIPDLLWYFCRLLLGKFPPLALHGPTGPLIIVIICFLFFIYLIILCAVGGIYSRNKPYYKPRLL